MTTKSRAAAITAVGALLTAGAVAGAVAGALPALSDEGPILNQGGQDAIEGQYLVKFRDAAVQQSEVRPTARALAAEHDGSVKYTYKHALRGFSVRMAEADARELAAEPDVQYVEQDARVRVADTQNNPPSWGTDRVDQRNLPIDSTYTYPSGAGAGVTVYVLDTGIRANHQDFAGRVKPGRDFVDNDNDPNDCHGHGTHVAGTAVGTSYGLAKKADTVALKVLGCNGSGDWSGIVAAIDWVTANAVKPAVANMSLGGSGTNQTLEDAVKKSVQSGVPYAIAAGNSNSDACNFTPARTPEAITVGNTDQTDTRNNNPAGPSNYGACLDIWAPGTSIVSASHGSDTGSATMSGTSMASPQVAGAAALYLDANPGASPEQVRAALTGQASKDLVKDPKAGSPNLLLYTSFLNGDPDPDPDPPGSLVNGGFEAGDVSGWTAGGTAKVTSVQSAGAHEGTKAARLGSTAHSNGESTLSQTFTVPDGADELTLHYSMTCPDTVTYAWARVVLTDDTAGTTSSPLAKTCTDGAGWKQVTAALTPGHDYTLTLVNRDDNHPDDPVYTSFDAVAVR